MYNRNSPLFAGLALIFPFNMVAIHVCPHAQCLTYAAKRPHAACCLTGLHTSGRGTRFLAQHVSKVLTLIRLHHL